MRWCWILAVAFLFVSCGFCQQDADDDDSNNGSATFESEQKKLLDAIKGIELPHFFEDTGIALKNLAGSVTICGLCLLVVKTGIVQRRLGANRQQLVDEFTKVCTLLKIEDERVCQGVTELNIDIFLYILDNRPGIKAGRFCGMILQNFNCPHELGYRDWTIDIPPGTTVEKKKVTDTGSKFNILHISDIHYDPLYTPGGNAVCDEPICCQSDQPAASKEEKKCGYWIDYRDADTPWHLVQETFRQANTHKFDYIYYTGDTISHRVWQTSVENNTKYISQIHNEFSNSFKVPVYPVLGNHEPHPLNQWPPLNIADKKLSGEWLFDLIADLWATWLPEDTKETIKKGGYYTAKVKDGFRVIALNGNVCYSYNWWLIYDDVDPYDQLKWLAKTLLEAGKAGEKVHILNHVPTGDDTCLRAWAKNYVKILNRFANTVVGQFTGHTHFDEFQVYYEPSGIVSKKAIGVGYNGASVTTFTNNNPSYKVFQIDDDSLGLIDYDEWTFNVTKANQNSEGPIDWYKLYSFKETYGVDTLDSDDIGELVERLAGDRGLLKTYNEFKSRRADPTLKETCNHNCNKNNLCSIVTTAFGEKAKCLELRGKYETAGITGPIKDLARKIF